MAGSPWICPRCGTATNTDACPRCLHERPLASGNTNQPGSYFRILQGPEGYGGLPSGAAFGCLVVLLAPIVAGLLRLFHLLR